MHKIGTRMRGGKLNRWVRPSLDPSALRHLGSVNEVSDLRHSLCFRNLLILSG